MTQVEYAKKNIITGLMTRVAQIEGVRPRAILELIKAGHAVIPANINHKLQKPCVIGRGLKTKVNANIGTSTERSKLKEELKKLEAVVACGADAVMDLSVGGDLRQIRKVILAASAVPVGTVPIYEIAVAAQKKHKDFLKFDSEDIWEVLEAQARSGVDFFTIHAGVTRKSLAALKTRHRIMGVVSRGGAILASWISRNKKENPFFAEFDRVLDIAYKYDVTLSLGDGLRPGSILDATDPAQIAELKILGGLAREARKRNVQVMIEGPGHVPLDQIKKNIELEKKYCDGAHFYVLGPLVTDIAPGYDHITGAIGGALAASFGADFLCYVTPAEHLRLPTLEDVKEGVIASRIAGHAGDIVKKIKGAVDWDRNISLARKKRDWKKQIELSLDPHKAQNYRLSSQPKLSDVCTMCGKYCSIKVMDDCKLRA
ncbi:MAG: phosphomethylpyrimidine synthase ThiC [Candidatus Omnitrophica bacterium]|nr:phosphomethylpyrimidine synthase ThiC [Candidatus Omnitrophota bacterium]